MRRDDQTRRFLRYLASLLGLALAMACIARLAFGRSFVWTFVDTAVGIFSAAATGAAVGAKAGRTSECRALRLSRTELAVRGAARASLFLGGMMGIAGRLPGLAGVLSALALGILCGYFSVYFMPAVTSAEEAYERALVRLQGGDTQGARQAIEEYLTCAEDDPVREARLPVAERFLRGETDTLDVPSELQASMAPEGRGTEVSAAERPAGTGTELLSVTETAPEGERIHQAPAERERPAP